MSIKANTYIPNLKHISPKHLLSASSMLHCSNCSLTTHHAEPTGLMMNSDCPLRVFYSWKSAALRKENRKEIMCIIVTIQTRDQNIHTTIYCAANAKKEKIKQHHKTHIKYPVKQKLHKTCPASLRTPSLARPETSPSTWSQRTSLLPINVGVYFTTVLTNCNCFALIFFE